MKKWDRKIGKGRKVSIPKERSRAGRRALGVRQTGSPCSLPAIRCYKSVTRMSQKC
jgi:hypothetical protein